MGKIYSTLTRPIRTFNIANRAEKIISREKPIPAPQHASVEKQKKLTDQAHPTFLENHYRKNEQLDQRLKDVFVTSTDSQKTVPETESRILPLNRHSLNEYPVDFYEPIVIPEGKCSLKQAFTFISKHRNDPTIYNSENIAAEYKMDKKVVDDILKHFKLYVTTAPNEPQFIPVDPLQDYMDKGMKDYKEGKIFKRKK